MILIAPRYDDVTHVLPDAVQELAKEFQISFVHCCDPNEVANALIANPDYDVVYVGHCVPPDATAEYRESQSLIDRSNIHLLNGRSILALCCKSLTGMWLDISSTSRIVGFTAKLPVPTPLFDDPSEERKARHLRYVSLFQNCLAQGVKKFVQTQDLDETKTTLGTAFENAEQTLMASHAIEDQIYAVTVFQLTQQRLGIIPG